MSLTPRQFIREFRPLFRLLDEPFARPSNNLTSTALFNEPFFKRGDFPSVVANGSDFIQLQDPWANGTLNVAPFDQPFYLIMNVAVGGTNGWFPDGVGGKPWLDGSLSES